MRVTVMVRVSRSVDVELALPFEAEVGACRPDIGCATCIESCLIADLQIVDLTAYGFLFSSIFLLYYNFISNLVVQR